MLRQHRAVNLQQFFVLSHTLTGTPHGAIVRYSDRLVVKLEDVHPFGFFTSILSALGEDPLSSLSRIQELLNEWRALFGVSVIIFQLHSQATAYQHINIPDMAQPWINLGKQP